MFKHCDVYKMLAYNDVVLQGHLICDNKLAIFHLQNLSQLTKSKLSVS